MKKIIYGSLFLTLVGIIVISCKKEQQTLSAELSRKTSSHLITFDTTFHISCDRGRLIFETAKSYETTISNMDSTFNVNLYKILKTMNYRSYREVKANDTCLIDSIGDDFLETILNEDLVVQIGEYLYRVNTTSNKVYALSVENIRDYDDLVSERTSNRNIMEYSTEEDVIDLVERGLPSGRGLFCGDRKAVAKTSTSNVVQVSAQPLVTMEMLSQYHKGGIIFTLKSQAGYKSNAGGTLHFYFQLDNCSYTIRCGNSFGPYSHPWLTASNINAGNDIHEVFRLYRGMKQLKTYDYKVRFRCENFNIPSSPNPYTIFFTNYVTIAD